MLSLPDGVAANKGNITEYLVNQILSGSLKHNDMLPNEIDFAAQFGVSRTMIRHILKNLEVKSLIQRKTNVGTRVRGIHSWNLLDQELLDWGSGVLAQSRFLLSFMELRLIIEPQAAALAAVRANDKDLLAIREHYDRMGVETQVDQPLVMDNEADIDFHKAIISACGNLFISQLGSVIQGALHHTVYLANKNHFDHASSLNCHRQVMEAIENRDPQKAYTIMCRVINNGMKDLNLRVSCVILPDYQLS